MKILNHAVQAVEMIVMRMRERHHIEPLDSARPKVRRDNFLADIDPRAVTANPLRAGLATAVNEHRTSIGEGREYRVALSNVEHGHLEFPAIKCRRERMNCD